MKVNILYNPVEFNTHNYQHVCVNTQKYDKTMELLDARYLKLSLWTAYKWITKHWTPRLIYDIQAYRTRSAVHKTHKARISHNPYVHKLLSIASSCHDLILLRNFLYEIPKQRQKQTECLCTNYKQWAFSFYTKQITESNSYNKYCRWDPNLVALNQVLTLAGAWTILSTRNFIKKIK